MKLDVKILVFKYVEKNPRTVLFDGNLPSDTWVDGFLRRYYSNLTTRTTQNKKVRVQRGLEVLEYFFNNLRETLKDVPPRNILTITRVLRQSRYFKVCFRTSAKHPDRIVNDSCVSIMFAVNAAGTCLPTLM